MARESKPFRDRNPVIIGAVSLTVIAALVFLAFNAQSLPLIGGGTVYKAQFSEAAGLQPDDPVRVAGVKVGKVESLALEHGAVTVEFRVKDAFVGDQSEAAIKIETVLGAKYLALVPRGEHRARPRHADPGRAAPRRPTTSSRPSPTCRRPSSRSTPPSWPTPSRCCRRPSRTPRTRCARRCRAWPRLSDTISSRDAQLGQLLLGDPQGHPGARRPQRRVHPADRRLQHAAHRGAAAPRADRLDPHEHPGAVAAAVGAGRPTTATALTPGAAAAVHGHRHPVPQPGGARRRRSTTWRRSSGSSPTPSATAAGSTASSTTCCPPSSAACVCGGAAADPAAASACSGGNVMSGSLQRGVAVAAAVVLLAALGWTILRPAGQYRVTAYFTQTVGLYPGSDVRILGIAVGSDRPTSCPQGDQVRVDDVDRRRLRHPGRRRRRRPRARPWCPTGTCSSRRSTTAAPKMKDGATVPLERTAHPGRARPGLRRARRAVRGARPERRQQERGAVGPRRRRRGQPRRATARRSTAR